MVSPAPALVEHARPTRLSTAADFILDAPPEVPAIWAHGSQVLWAKGEPLMIAAPQGLGKTTLAGQLALARHGAVDDPTLLGAKVEIDPKPVLYLACDRPNQIARSFQRMVDERHRAALEYMRIWKGPLRSNLASSPELLVELALEAEAGTIFIDSLKDVALDLSTDETGSRVNNAIQLAIAEGIEVVVLHHQRKSSSDNKAPRTLDDVYGSGWLTAGMGSVVLLWGKPGDPIVELRHLKQPADEFGPVSLLHDHEHGTTTLHEPTDLLALANRPGGVTVEDAAKALFGTREPDRNQREKARRRLERLLDHGVSKRSGSPTAPAIYAGVLA